MGLRVSLLGWGDHAETNTAPSHPALLHLPIVTAHPLDTAQGALQNLSGWAVLCF
jgi:hypothetical protein